MPDNNVPTIEEAFGQQNQSNSDVPTVEQAFGNYSEPKTYTGEFSDYFFSKNAFGRVLDAFGQGVKNQWGAVQLPTETGKEVSNAGLSEAYDEHNKAIAKATSEAWMRSAADVFVTTNGYAALQTLNTPLTLLSGITEAIGQTGHELKQSAKNDLNNKPLGLDALSVINYGLGYSGAQVKGSIGELLENFASGAIPESSLHAPATRARATGAIGEGERGYFNTVPVTEEHIAQRTEAAQEAATKPVIPEKPNLDVDNVARQIDPYSFSEYDRLTELKSNLKDNIDYVTKQRAAEIQKDIHLELATRGESDKVQALRDNLDNILNDPAVQEARQRYLDADYQLRDLIPDLASARRWASDLMPDPSEIAEIRAKELKTTLPEEPVQNRSEKPVQASTVELSTEPSSSDRTVVEASKWQNEGIGSLRPIQGSGETKPLGLSRHLLADEIEAGWIDKDNLPSYQVLSKTEQADRALAFVESNLDDAIKVIKGERNAPENVHPEAIMKALNYKLLESGDFETYYKLAMDPHMAEQAKTMGQRIGLLADIEPTDPVRIVQQVNKERKASARPKAVKTEVESIKKEIKKSNPTKDDWITFVKSIECDY